MFVQLFGVPGVWPGSDTSKSLERLIRAEIPDALNGEVHVYVHTTGHLCCDDAVVVTVDGAQPAEEDLSQLCSVVGNFIFAQKDKFPQRKASSLGRFERIKGVRVISSTAGFCLSRKDWGSRDSRKVLSINAARAA